MWPSGGIPLEPKPVRAFFVWLTAGEGCLMKRCCQTPYINHTSVLDFAGHVFTGGLVDQMRRD
jgi:hypothetical protein